MPEYPLTRDPLFQLNCCIWLVRRAPENSSSPPPALNRAGFSLRALNLRTTVPDVARSILQEKLDVRGKSPEPDAVLRHNQSGDHLVLECKASSFGPDSSTSMQCRKLLAVCANPKRSLGATGGAAALVYVLHHEDSESQLVTLETLSSEMTGHKIPTGIFGVLGLEQDESGLWADIAIRDDNLTPAFASANGRHLVTEATDGDSRPLYFIPYDPASYNQQVPGEQEYCSRQLSQRIVTHALSQIGRAESPNTVRLQADDILRAVTYQVSDHWDGNDKNSLKNTIIDKLYRFLHRNPLREKVDSRQGSYVEVALADQEDQTAALNLLQTANISQLERGISELTLSLEAGDELEEHNSGIAERKITNVDIASPPVTTEIEAPHQKEPDAPAVKSAVDAKTESPELTKANRRK